MAGTGQPTIATLGLHSVPVGAVGALSVSVGTTLSAANRCGFYSDLSAGTERVGVVSGAVEVARFNNVLADSTVYMESLGYAVLAEHLRLGDVPGGYTPVNGDLSYTGTGLRLYNGGTWETLVTTGSGAAGSPGEVQYNDAGGLGASSSFTYNDTTKTLTVGSASDEPVLALSYDITDVIDREASITFSLGTAITEKRDFPGPVTRFDILSAAQVTTLQGSGGVVIGLYSASTGAYEYANSNLLFLGATATLTTYELSLSVGLVNTGYLNTPITDVATSSVLTRDAVAFRQTASPVTSTLWASPVDGDTVMIRNDSGGPNTVAPDAADTVEGVTSFPLGDGEAMTLIYHALTNNWLVY